jgi:hypothetical protein
MVQGIDAQHLVTQTYITEKVQNVQQRQGDLQQHYFDVQLAEERKRLQSKIKQAEDAEKMKFKERHQERNKGGHKDPDEECPDEEKHTIDLKA